MSLRLAASILIEALRYASAQGTSVTFSPEFSTFRPASRSGHVVAKATICAKKQRFWLLRQLSVFGPFLRNCCGHLLSVHRAKKLFRTPPHF
jgi:hypothetical protein